MQAKPFHIYRSSAGSGKTRTLAKAYIKLALRWQPHYFRHILAVTFTNKSTQEMKSRILLYLDAFARAQESDLATEIQQDLRLTPQQLREKSKAVLTTILHNYSQFAISTIDAFFQRVIRSFTREAGLLGNFRLEVENDLVLKEVVDELMDELGTDPQLTEWVVEFSRDRLLEGENWNIIAALNNFGKEIFNENFQQVEDQLARGEGEGNVYRDTMSLLQREIKSFHEFMNGRAKRALQLIDEAGITMDDFSYKDQGTAFKYFVEFSKDRYFLPGSRIQAALSSAKSWPSKKSRNFGALMELADQQLIPILQEMVQYDATQGIKYRTADQVLKNFYAFGLIADITRKLKAYKQENNIMLLSDAPKFLNGVINESDTPFIYEKVGSWFRNYLIDEFQDTSGFQWKNFQPLLKDALDQNQQSMIVGDVKQSIYRWRGGDLQLLQEEVGLAMGPDATEVLELNTNYRSSGVLVGFNNELFAQAAQIVANLTGQPLSTAAFHDVEQQPFRFMDKGYVNISFIERPEEEEDWTAEVNRRLPKVLEDLQDQGVRLKDIAVLVRKNEEGQRIATELLQYQHSHGKPGYRYDVVSNESLRLDTAASVNLLLSAMKYLHNPMDAIVRGQLSYEAMGGEQLDTLFMDAGKFEMDHLLPEEFVRTRAWLGKLSIFELSEELIRIFDLGKMQSELAYLQAFQDLVLEFSAQEKNDLASFLEWWESVKGKKSIQVAGHVDAVNILTIHKAKGLQFKYVIIPFLNWRLNHEVPPLLWVHSRNPPFNEMGYLAVRYSSSLKETYFAGDYEIEMAKAYLDNLNLLYVAFTRAEEGLFAFALTPGARQQERPGSVGDLVYASIANHLSLASHLNEGVFERGVLEHLDRKEETDAYLPASLTKYQSFDWRQKLVIKREGAEFFLEEVSAQRSSINYGILLHRLLSHIHHQPEAQQVLDELHIQNVFTDEERVLLSKKLSSMMQDTVISAWFNKEWKVLTEVPVLVPGGRQNRIDRVMLGKKKTIIVDYKTGEKRSADRRQVESYAGLLAEMGYPHVEAYLLYLEEMEVVAVIKGSTTLLEF